ncbi:MAG: hypothetical protein SF123_02950 [Chloroflexota bacterium]|nr:hypothetical protein [Chloroflexota bacterium]
MTLATSTHTRTPTCDDSNHSLSPATYANRDSDRNRRSFLTPDALREQLAALGLTRVRFDAWQVDDDRVWAHKPALHSSDQ